LRGFSYRRSSRRVSDCCTDKSFRVRDSLINTSITVSISGLNSLVDSLISKFCGNTNCCSDINVKSRKVTFHIVVYRNVNVYADCCVYVITLRKL
jgi:hypothetical protein